MVVAASLSIVMHTKDARIATRIRSPFISAMLTQIILQACRLQRSTRGLRAQLTRGLQAMPRLNPPSPRETLRCRECGAATARLWPGERCVRCVRNTFGYTPKRRGSCRLPCKTGGDLPLGLARENKRTIFRKGEVKPSDAESFRKRGLAKVDLSQRMLSTNEKKGGDKMLDAVMPPMIKVRLT